MNPNKTIEELAQKVIDQYDNYDIHRETESDKLLYSNGVEPDDVFLARGLLHYKQEYESLLSLVQRVMDLGWGPGITNNVQLVNEIRRFLAEGISK
jgi:cobalamin biosynthesis Co2+ chelatase CbiK